MFFFPPHVWGSINSPIMKSLFTHGSFTAQKHVNKFISIYVATVYFRHNRSTCCFPVSVRSPYGAATTGYFMPRQHSPLCFWMKSSLSANVATVRRQTLMPRRWMCFEDKPYEGEDYVLAALVNLQQHLWSKCQRVDLYLGGEEGKVCLFQPYRWALYHSCSQGRIMRPQPHRKHVFFFPPSSSPPPQTGFGG